MPRLRIATLLTLALIGPTIALADDPPRPTPPVKVEDPLKPVPPVAIPDDPPPHEGAMIDIPYAIEPPDIITVEVLEALPGRPITGERLVRSDGTISLGFYGDIYVRGLTTRQAKVKILLHLRNYINDEMLGLVLSIEEGEAEADPWAAGTAPAGSPNFESTRYRTRTMPPRFLPEIVPRSPRSRTEAKPLTKPESPSTSSISSKERSRSDRARPARRARAALAAIGRSDQTRSKTPSHRSRPLSPKEEDPSARQPALAEGPFGSAASCQENWGQSRHRTGRF